MSSLSAVSVVIPAHNRANLIGRAVDSVIKQTRPPDEIIVVDDGSRDGTADVALKYGPKVHLVRRDTPSGLPAVARNEGLRVARGDFIALLDSDDYWYPEKLELQIALMETSPGIGLCHSFCNVVDADDHVLYLRREADMPRGPRIFLELLASCFMTTSSVIFRRQVLDAVGGFNESPELRCGDDWEWFLRVARRFDVGFVSTPLVGYTVSADSILSPANPFKAQRNILGNKAWLVGHPGLWSPEVDIGWMRNRYLDELFEYAYRWRTSGRPDLIMRLWQDAFRFAPMAMRSHWSVLKQAAAACFVRSQGNS